MKDGSIFKRFNLFNILFIIVRENYSKFDMNLLLVVHIFYTDIDDIQQKVRSRTVVWEINFYFQISKFYFKGLKHKPKQMKKLSTRL